MKQERYIQQEFAEYTHLSELGLLPGTHFFLTDVKVTKQKGFGLFNVAGYWRRKYQGKVEDEGWYLLTNLDTNQEAVFHEEDRRIEKSPYWQDTCTLKPIFEAYFKKKFPRVQSIDYLELKPNSKVQGLDNWDQALVLVQQALSGLDVDKNATVYVSHQAGTPAISSAVKFDCLAKFGKKSSFWLVMSMRKT